MHALIAMKVHCSQPIRIDIISRCTNSGEYTKFYSCFIISFQALRCLISWVQFGITLSDVDVLETSILSCLKNDELFDTAIDALVEITTCPESYKYSYITLCYISVL
jgi:hypothetical protein